MIASQLRTCRVGYRHHIPKTQLSKTLFRRWSEEQPGNRRRNQNTWRPTHHLFEELLKATKSRFQGPSRTARPRQYAQSRTCRSLHQQEPGVAVRTGSHWCSVHFDDERDAEIFGRMTSDWAYKPTHCLGAKTTFHALIAGLRIEGVKIFALKWQKYKTSHTPCVGKRASEAPARTNLPTIFRRYCRTRKPINTSFRRNPTTRHRGFFSPPKQGVRGPKIVWPPKGVKIGGQTPK